MTNPFYNASGNPGDRAPGSSQTMRAEFVSIQQGFDKLPTSLSPNTVVVVNPGGTALTTTAYALALGGALTLAGAFTTTGPYATTLAQQANTTLTLPASNATLATLALAETLSNKTLTSPVVNTPTVNNGTFNSPVLVTPQLGTPASGNLSNCTALPIATGVSGLAAGVATFLGTPSSANLLAAMTDETGTGPLVFGTSPTLNTPTLNSPTLVTPNLGTPSAGNLANCTNLPLTTGTSGVLPQAKGGTGSSFVAALGAIFFQGPSSTFGSDSGNINWNNTDKTLGIGTVAPGGASWRTLIRSFGPGTYPIVLQNGAATVTGFYVTEDSNGDFAAQVANKTNLTTIRFHTAATSYFTGGTLGIGTTTPTAYLGVQDPSGNLTPDDVFRVGSTGNARFLRMGVTDVLINGSPGNQAPYIQSNYNNNKALNYALLLNPAGGNVSINSSRQPAAALDVAGDIAIWDNGLTFTPYNGVTNTGAVRAGIKYAGGIQEVQFFTDNTYRGAVSAVGDWYMNGYLGVGSVTINGSASRVQINGDVSTLQASGGLYMNSQWQGGFYRTSAGYPAALRLDNGGMVQLLGDGTGAAGAAWTARQLIGIGLQSGNFGNVAVGSIGIFWPKFDVQGDLNGDIVSRVFNQNSGGATVARMQLDLTAFANNAVLFDIRRNNSNPYSIIQNAAGVPLLYFATPTGVYTQINGTDRLRVEGSAVTVLGVALNNTYTGGNFFGNLLLQGLTGTGGFVRSTDNTPLYLGANGNNVVAVHNSGSYFYPLADYAVQCGASGNRWSQVHSFEYFTWGTASGYTRLTAQVAAANNVVTLPPYTGTLLIGGTQISADLGSTDVLLNNTGAYFNGPSIALPAGGTWEVQSAVILQDAGGSANFENRLTDGANIRSSGYVSSYTAGATVQCVLKGFFAGGTTVTHQVIDITSTNGKILSTTLSSGAGQPRASWIQAKRVA